MFLLRAVLNILVRNASQRGPLCFRCLIFNFSGPCELLFTLILFSVISHIGHTCVIHDLLLDDLIFYSI